VAIENIDEWGLFMLPTESSEFRLLFIVKIALQINSKHVGLAIES
jgi:hypothetical protein